MKPTKIIIHCTATPKGRDVSIEEVRKWHVEGNGWSDIGYHYLICLDGRIRRGRPPWIRGAHTKGHNDSIGIAYVGGMDVFGKDVEDTLTRKQKESMQRLVDSVRERHGPLLVYGHNEFSSKACPSFDVNAKLGEAYCKFPV